ncbi:MAG TPA: recombinase family protein [Anaeromyxobacteraceae bacterium]|jgi:DNA invertase Pin-like site-specific DNA recombinase|nr:recombinase family protein [Anaeromyxobacteraceae bacterium]
MRTKKERTRVIGYVRVSTDAQAEEGVSLEAQREKLRAYALATDLDLVAIREDAGVSAKTLARPALQAALDDLKAGRADGLLVAKLDRLTRSVRDLGSLLEGYFASRFSLLSIADAVDTRTAGGRLVLNVLCSVAQWEREAIGERTADALRHLKAKGVRLGGEALGWRRTGEKDAEGHCVVVEDLEERATARRIRDLRARGLSLRAICERLAAEGRRTKRGGGWAPQTVRQVLARDVAVPRGAAAVAR